MTAWHKLEQPPEKAGRYLVNTEWNGRIQVDIGYWTGSTWVSDAYRNSQEFPLTILSWAEIPTPPHEPKGRKR